MEVTIHISNNNQPLKQLTELHNSSVPSLIGALSRIKESTNNFLTELINNSNEGKSGKGDTSAIEDEEGDEDGDDEGEKSASDEKQNKKRKSSNQQNRKRWKHT